MEAVAREGLLLEPEALKYLQAQGDPLAALRRGLDRIGEKPLVLTLQDIQTALETQGLSPLSPAAGSQPEPPPTFPVPSVIESSGELVKPRAPASSPTAPSKPRRQHDSHLEVLRDITGNSRCQGKIEDFSRYFAHRFRTLGGLLRAKRELHGALPIAKAKRMAREIRFIAMVRDVRTTKAGHRILEVEDEEESCAVLLTKDGPLAREPVVPDEVLGIVGSSWKEDLIIAEKLVRPEVTPLKGFRGEGADLWAAFISDIHVGSRLFLRDRFLKFLEWLRDGDDLARGIKYVVLSGDVVDGIGVYPRQDEDLLVDDVYRQYEEVAGYLNTLPEGVKTILLPGNHDAVRPAEPQPALPAEIQRLFSADIAFVGNPCYFRLHGVTILSYHGRSMDDLVSALPGMGYDRPLEAMKEMLRRRHLAPIYGGKTPIAPEAQDYLVIDPIPDIFVTGHVHGAGLEEYQGIRLINSSTWQAQTSYQRMHNIDPRTGRAVFVNLATGQMVSREF